MADTGQTKSISAQLCAVEHAILSPRAAFADKSTRPRAEPDCDVRTAFQRDRDRILHCRAFRRLKHKTQVFLSPAGDHFRTRLTHTLEVAQIARTIARALRLNEDLTEAIALGHDLGHTPFGHAGERALQQVFYQGFHHYEQSLRMVDLLEKDGRGLNLTNEVRDGILRHTCDPLAATLEGQCVRLSDRIAYINHDIDDAVRAGVLQNNEVPRELGETKSGRINTLVRSAIAASAGDCIALEPSVAAPFEALHRFMFDQVYFNPVCKSEESKAIDMIVWLYQYFSACPARLPDDYRAICRAEGAERAAVDYIAGMTDRFAVHVFKTRFIPKGWGK
ncbi:MAG: deoxyguanosinetriphosphate triphosphohydrolase [Oscillospiraceae bacterium]|jgi:dGTPase|nr:deoxyguanosinetriphosphate triphosphohydrolase [Oscillospiraceae bacterium]